VQVAKDHGWRLVVLFGSSAFAEEGRDVDFAVMPRSRPGLLEQGDVACRTRASACTASGGFADPGEHTSPITRFEVLWRALPVQGGGGPVRSGTRPGIFPVSFDSHRCFSALSRRSGMRLSPALRVTGRLSG